MKWSPRLKEYWRSKGYHVGNCYKCGQTFAYAHKVAIPHKGSKAICPSCKKKMGLES